ncbi:MAG: endonuclease MutS2 [Nitrospinae bacterium]|nr:endonuclease MutS2 [Nitrospinota bacterium]
MDGRTLQGIEFEDVLKLLEARCASKSGAAAAAALVPLTSSFKVDTLLDETDEAVALQGAGEYMPLAAFDDPEGWLEDIRRRGGNLEGEKFLSILSLLNLASDVRRFVEERAERLPRLRMRIHGADMLYPLAARIRRILDERGEVRDDASLELQESRAKQRALRNEIRRLLDRVMAAHPNAVQENLIVQRRERYLIPARTTFKRSFEGVIQDRSSSGETLFVEPLSAVPVNNAIAEEREAERAEVERILRELTEGVMASREAIVYLVQCLAGLDLIWAKARLGVDWRGARAQASADGSIRLKAARHPLLTAGVGAVPKEQVVPIDLEVGRDGMRQLLITGPNTGGKTVALKTVGLCVALHQCGVPIPAAPESALPVVKTLVADIGDEQDIQQNLSTFSGHMARVSGAVREAGEGVLVLLDELGSGTDPAEGSAIGVSVLEHLAESGALCIVTTHHDALKHYAYQAAHAENASVEFDADDLSPTYRIRMGAAGPSNAMSVAQMMGLPESVLARADVLLTKGPVQVDRLMANLSDQGREMEEKEADLSARRVLLEARERELERQLSEEARQRGDDAARFLKDLRREADDLLNEMRGALEMEEAKRIARERIRELSAGIEKALPRREEAATRAPVSLRVKDRVRIPLMNCTGEVVALHGDDELTVSVNGKSLRLSCSVVEVLDDAPVAPARRSTVTHDVLSRGDDFSPELQLRGVRAEHALEMVDKYLDDAALVGIASVRIVHGKGEGVLSQVIAERLKEHTLVSKFGPARPEEGGWGVTNVELALR